jgi:hypothetical protein
LRQNIANISRFFESGNFPESRIFNHFEEKVEKICGSSLVPTYNPLAFRMLRKVVRNILPGNVRVANMSTNTKLVVNSHNEFDPLEEVIVGRVEGSTIPEWHVSGKAVWPERVWDMYKTKSGKPFPKELMENGKFCFNLFYGFYLTRLFFFF